MVLTENKKEKLQRNESIRKEFDATEGMKGPKYALLAKKYGLSRIRVQMIILEGLK